MDRTTTETLPLVSIVIPTHNRREMLTTLIESIKKSVYPHDKIEIVVVDDASTDGTFETIQKLFPKIRILRNQSERFPSECRNLGAAISKGNVIFFIDDDNVLDKNTISELVRIIVKCRGVGLVGPVAYYKKTPEKIFCAGGKLNYPILFPTYILQGTNKKDLPNEVIQCDYIPNAFMIRKKIINYVGFFDERFSIGWEETDFAVRLKKKGFKTIVVPSAEIFHDVPIARDVHVTETRAYWRGKNRVLFYRKHLPPRAFLIFLDIMGFLMLLLKLNDNVQTCFSQYIKGLKNGLTFKMQPASK